MGESGAHADRYRTVRKLGEGGAGKVSLVEDLLSPGSRVALKELVDSGPEREVDLRREFATLSALRHPSLAEVYDLDRSPETARSRFTMEFIEGDDLVATVRNEGPSAFLDLAGEALRALGFLHDFKVLHRDLKPANILVRRRPRLGCRLVLLDFGLAVESHSGDFSGARMAGTLPYLAPELLRGAPPSWRTDLYGLGAVLFEAVYGRPPFEYDGADFNGFVELVREGLTEAPDTPPGYPEGIGGWLLEMLAADPSLRPAQASEALARLDAACKTSHSAEVAASRAARLASGPPPGREAEISTLLAQLDAPDAADSPRIVLLCGGAGAGKTRLLRWLAGDAVRRDWAVRSLASEIAAAASAEAGAGAGAQTLERLVQRLRTDAAAQRVLWLADEVEIADGFTVRLLDRLAREATRSPVRVVAALRATEATQPIVRKLLADVGVAPSLRRVDLAPLDLAGVRALAERATGSTAVSEARVKWLLDGSEGSPAIAEALLVEGIWEKGGRGRVALPRPERVSGRLDLLSERGRSWLEALVIAGDAGDEELGELAGLPSPAAREVGEEVAAAGLARRENDRWRPDSRSTSELVRERMNPQLRSELQQRVVRRVVEREGATADPWRLARLWSAAGERERTVEAALRAAQHSIRQSDPAEAAERFGFALRHMERRDPRRRAIRMRQATTLDEAGLWSDAGRAAGAALALSKNKKQRIEALVAQSMALSRVGSRSRCHAAATEALKLATAVRVPILVARAKLVLGAALTRMSRETEALKFLKEAAEAFRESGDVQAQGQALSVAAAAQMYLKLPEAEATYRAAAELHLAAGRMDRWTGSRAGLGSLLAGQRRYEEATVALEDARRSASERGDLATLQSIATRFARIAIETGRLDIALVSTREAEAQALHRGHEVDALISRDRRAHALFECGRPGEAAILFRSIVDAAPGKWEPDAVEMTRLSLARALMDAPDPDEGEIRLLIATALERLRPTRKRSSILYGLLIELERRARVGCTDPFEAAYVEFQAVAGSNTSRNPEHESRAVLAHARYQLTRRNFEGARASAVDAVEIAAGAEGADLLVIAAAAKGVLSEALEQLSMPQEAGAALEAGRKLVESASARIHDAAVRADFLLRSDLVALRSPTTGRGASADHKVGVLYEMIRMINSETDPDAVLEMILDTALREVRAERGLILLREPGKDSFSVCTARNAEAETEKDALGFSKSIIAQAGAGKSILTLDAGHDERFRDLRSVSLYGIRSLMCVPLRSRAKIVGTVYLDTRREGAFFSQADLRFVEAFADHAALALENTRRVADLERENRRLQADADSRVQLGSLVGRAPAMQAAFDLVEKYAASDLPVLILGESGTGKELVARAIHALGPLRRKPFLSENCAAIPESLQESELFGVMRGAFTGADRDRPGLFEQADGGTLFLDEIGDTSPGMQSRLLRVLQEHEIRRVGGERTVKVKVRLLAATNKDLASEAEAGRVRQDLLFRLQVLMLRMPPLRERPGDIPLLVQHLLTRISKQRARAVPDIEREVLDLFERYSWPGNVRELENAVQRLALLAGDQAISRGLVESDPDLRRSLCRDVDAGVAFLSLERSEREQIARALQAAGGNRERAARLLGISRATIFRKIKEYGLS